MSRKNYQAMAEALRYARPWLSTEGAADADTAAVAQWMTDVRNVADCFAADNGRFDRERFYAACGWEA